MCCRSMGLCLTRSRRQKKTNEMQHVNTFPHAPSDTINAILKSLGSSRSGDSLDGIKPTIHYTSCRRNAEQLRRNAIFSKVDSMMRGRAARRRITLVRERRAVQLGDSPRRALSWQARSLCHLWPHRSMLGCTTYGIWQERRQPEARNEFTYVCVICRLPRPRPGQYGVSTGRYVW